MRVLWRRTVALGFRLLYNELAWTYDLVSWLASRGLWRRWQQTALSFLPPGGCCLEVGFGPGHLLVEMAEGVNRAVVGLDLSPAMLRLARRRLERRGLSLPLVRGRAWHLPFASGVFEAVILTFPTSFVYEPAWIRDMVRVLRHAGAGADAPDGGRLVVVEQAGFEGRGLLNRIMEWLYAATGQRGPAPDLPSRLEEAGLIAWRETVPVDGTTVGLVLAEKPGPV